MFSISFSPFPSMTSDDLLMISAAILPEKIVDQTPRKMLRNLKYLKNKANTHKSRAGHKQLKMTFIDSQ